MTGAIDENTRFVQGDIRGNETHFSPENIQQNLKLVKVLKDWSVKKEATPAQISLAWLLHQKPWIVPIPGTTQMSNMLDNIGADKIKFTNTEFKEFNTQIDAVKIAGERLPPFVQKFSDVEAPVKK